MASTLFETEAGTTPSSPAVSARTRLLQPSARSMVRSAVSHAAPAYRWVCSQRLVRERLAPWLRGVGVDDFSPTGRGLGPDDGLRRLERDGVLAGATVLVMGVGRGPEVESYWLDRGVSHVIGVDLSSYPTDWGMLRNQAASRGVRADFGVMDGSRLAARDNSVDVVFSQSVLEHVLDLDAFLAESARVLTRGGRFYAYFGPLWSTYGGPHVGALGYDHLLVDDEAYLEAARQVGGGWEHWLEEGLFNRLCFDDYVEHIERHFTIERLGVVASTEGSAYRDRDRHTWDRLLTEHDEKDLLVNLVSVIASPRS